MAWTDDPAHHFGFTTGEPWLPMPSRAAEINLARDLASEKSVYRFYR